MSHQFPAEVILEQEDNTGAVTYTIPKNLIGIRQPVSEEFRQQSRERALKANLRPPFGKKVPMVE